MTTATIDAATIDTPKTAPKSVTVKPEQDTQGRDVSIPLDKLFLSPNNVRKTRNKQSIPELAALIESQGILQRLLITDAGDGRFAVEAGGRRLEACQYLAGKGTYAADQSIDCRLFPSRRAVAISMAENSGREAMHPADQFVAFSKLVTEELFTVAQVATQFGVSKLTVERRMALANVAPRFIELYREGKINTDQMQVLCLSSDHAQQIAAWDSLNDYQRSAYMLKQALLNGDVEGDDRIAQFVGIDNYIAAGGAVRRDLFAERADQCWLEDGALLQRLALARLETFAAAERDAGWSWVEVQMKPDSAGLAKFDRERPKPRKLTDEEADGLDDWKELAADARLVRIALAQQYDKLADEVEDSDELDALYLAVEEAEAIERCMAEVVSELHASLAVWSPKQLAQCGVIVTLSHAGDVQITRGLMRAQDKKVIVAELKKAGKPVPASLQGAKTAERAAFSERLMHDMTAHRTAALQASLADNAHVALALVVQRLASPIFIHNEYTGDGPLKITATLTRNSQLSSRATEYDESPAAQALEAMQTRWGDRVPGTSKALFPWLLKQEDAVLLELLAFCAASSIDAMRGREREGYHLVDALADALDVDMADWWTPTPAKYLGSVSNAQAMDAVTEACGAEVAKPMAGMKKGEAVTYAAAKLDGKGWLPAPLKRQVPEKK